MFYGRWSQQERAADGLRWPLAERTADSRALSLWTGWETGHPPREEGGVKRTFGEDQALFSCL